MSGIILNSPICCVINQSTMWAAQKKTLQIYETCWDIKNHIGIGCTDFKTAQCAKKLFMTVAGNKEKAEYYMYQRAIKQNWDIRCNGKISETIFLGFIFHKKSNFIISLFIPYYVQQDWKHKGSPTCRVSICQNFPNKNCQKSVSVGDIEGKCVLVELTQ